MPTSLAEVTFIVFYVILVADVHAGGEDRGREAQGCRPQKQGSSPSSGE